MGIGVYAAKDNSGAQATAIGMYAGDGNEGDYLSAIGYDAGKNNTGDNVVAIGSASLRGNTSNNAVGIGYQALYNRSATDTVAIGYYAGRGATSGDGFSNGVMIGYRAGYGITTGSNNTFIGYQAGDSTTTGANNIYIGYNASEAASTGSNNIVIGHDIESAIINGSNQLTIGNLIYGTSLDGTGTTVSSGNVGIGTKTPNDGKLEVKGGSVCVDTNNDGNATSCITTESDIRLKKNLTPIAGALAKVNALRGVYFDWRWDEYDQVKRFEAKPHDVGVIAQEVEAVLPEALDEETGGFLAVSYDRLVPLLIEAVKELKVENDILKERLDVLEAK